LDIGHSKKKKRGKKLNQDEEEIRERGCDTAVIQCHSGVRVEGNGGWKRREKEKKKRRFF